MRHGREVRGYTAVLHKHERIGGQLVPPEVVEVAFREEPHSVRLNWLKGARRAGTVLYVQGENNNKVLVKPAGLLGSMFGIVERGPDSDDARQSGRYPLPEFGIRRGMERILATWVAAQKRQALHVEYLETRPIADLGDRTCHVLRRTGYERPARDGIAELTLYVDSETWLQTGTVLRDDKGELIASYFFRNVQLNPTFSAGQFTRDGLTR